MKKLLQKQLSGNGLRARALRSSGWTLIGFGGSQVIRLASNLILTRMLFPEAFGLMALVLVFIQGLAMFSDLGIGPSIMQSKRGDDPDFLDTAWTIQTIRGALLWLVSCLIAYPISNFYNEPQLALLLPVTGIGILIAGFNPTRVETAHRHLIFGRVSTIQIATQAVGVIAAIAFAYYTKSVWAFVFSNIISGLAQLWMFNKFLPGHKNSFRWERPAAEELIKFGKWIFLSTLCSFLFQQGDKMILGKFLSIENLGVYNIGFFLASFPIMMSSNIVYKVLVPLYREKPPSASRENYQKLRKMRILFTSGVLGMLMIFAFLGVILVQFMYDDRYQAAGAIVVMIAVMQIPNVIVLTYSQSALATGDSRRYFMLSAVKAFFMVTALIIGAQYYGLIGALVAQGAATLLIYPVAVWLARQQGAWDPWHDLFFAIIGAILAVLALWVNMDAIIELTKLGTS